MSDHVEGFLTGSLKNFNQGRSVQPTNPFLSFKKGEVEQSISDCFEKIVAKYPNRIAVKTKRIALSYEALNKEANRIAHVPWAGISIWQYGTGTLPGRISFS